MTTLDAFLAGDYSLISFQLLRDGVWIDMNYQGCIRYDGAGNMMALGMRRDLPARSAAGQSTGPGGFAYWAGVSVFPQEQRVEHHVKGCTTHPQWVGGIQERWYSLQPDGVLQLMTRAQDGSVNGILSWQKRP